MSRILFFSEDVKVLFFQSVAVSSPTGTDQLSNSGHEDALLLELYSLSSQIFFFYVYNLSIATPNLPQINV